jgi:hypothetical protein
MYRELRKRRIKPDVPVLPHAMIVLLFALRLRRHMFDLGVGGVAGGGDHVLASWMVRVGKLAQGKLRGLGVTYRYGETCTECKVLRGASMIDAQGS